jgi:CRISPR associated protein Cas1
MGRTLYLNECRGLRVLRDGPSIWISRSDRAGQRVPVRLISRVIIIGNVKLDSGVITLFTDHDVPVVFMGYSGNETAVAIPYNHRLAKHYSEQQVFLDGHEHIERYITWADTKRMVIQVETLNRIFKRADGKLRFGLGDGNYQMILSRLRPVDEEQWCVVTGIVNNIFRGMIIERLLRADLDPHLGVLHRRHNFGLALDICHIMGAESDIQAVQFFRCPGQKPCIGKKGNSWAVTAEGMRNIIQRFENRREALANIVELIIDELFALMRELRT